MSACMGRDVDDGVEVVVDGVDGYLITPCFVIRLHCDTGPNDGGLEIYCWCVRVEDVAGYLITPGFVIIELHLNPVSVETIAEVNGRQIPSRDTSVFRLGVGAPTRNIGGGRLGRSNPSPRNTSAVCGRPRCVERFLIARSNPGGWRP